MAKKELRIKEICKAKGMTLEALAERLGIRRTSLAQAMSRNNFSLDKLGEIADVLGVDIPDLFQKSDFLAIIRMDGKHYHADSLDELKDIVARL